MPAGWRAFPDAQDKVLLVHLLLIGLLVRLLPVLALLLLALLALTLLLVTVLRGLLRVAVLGIVHRSPSMALPQRPGLGAATLETPP